MVAAVESIGLSATDCVCGSGPAGSLECRNEVGVVVSYCVPVSCVSSAPDSVLGEHYINAASVASVGCVVTARWEVTVDLVVVEVTAVSHGDGVALTLAVEKVVPAGNVTVSMFG